MTGGNGWPFMSPAKSAPGSSAQLHTQKTHRGRSAYETVETAFTRVFERDIWTARSRLAVDTWLGRPVVYYLEAMPGRKFCSVVPWLCAGGESSVLLDCLAAELLFILFYCMDDDLDGKTTRYGVTTALGRFGGEAVERSAERAESTPLVTAFFDDRQDQRELWLASLAAMRLQQTNRIALPVDAPLDAYRWAAAERTAFIGAWWMRAAAMTGDQELSDTVRQVYPRCAVTGQLRNDLRNLTARETACGGTRYSDFLEGRATAVTMRALRRTDARDRTWLLEHVWARRSALPRDDAGHLAAILDRLEVAQDVIEEIRGDLSEMYATIEGSALDRNVKRVWRAWMFRQFETGVFAPHSAPASWTGEFHRAIDQLLDPSDTLTDRRQSRRSFT